MTQSQKQELVRLDKGFQTVGLDKGDLHRMDYLHKVHSSEVQELADKLKRGLARKVTTI